MSQSSRLLELAHSQLYWPAPQDIWEPKGAGPSVYARLAEEKIGKTIRREYQDAAGAKVSVLAANPDGDATEAPIAVVCEFSRPVSDRTIRETHRLAWSFSRARSLITLEPHLLRVWTCCEYPKDSEQLEPVAEIPQESLSEQAAASLQWVDLVSGNFFQEYEDRFRKSGSADQMLLSNLKEVRRQLLADGLDQETIHDLLARIIFIQFLFQKKDSNGNAALSDRVLHNLYEQGVLANIYHDLSGLLENFDDTYHFFRWLNKKFNGDLFPGKSGNTKDREAEWQAEINKVRTKDNKYLNKLAQFVKGDLEMRSNQLSLWKYYSFDVIPLDFISSIYEEFVKKESGTGIHYTPEYIVDFVLDGVLPWDEDEWNLKILDPACGSGIFLVKAFQRLIYRWERVHNWQRVKADTLISLLENNLFGIDIHKEAVRVASFSLYLTMLDSLEPQDYCLEHPENVIQFPRLRGIRLIAADFFQEDKPGFRTNEDAGTYDLVIGNAPWGKNTCTKHSKEWEHKKENKGKWASSYGNIGPLFLPKAAFLTKRNGQVSMMEPILAMLFYQDKAAVNLRLNLMNEFKVEEVVNLATLRFGLFKDAVSPACIITLRVEQPDEEPFCYICPKPVYTTEDDYRLIIEPQDINYIYPQETVEYPLIWAALTWGGRRDFALMKRLAQRQNILKLAAHKEATYSQGIIRGNRKERNDALVGRKLFDDTNFPQGTFLYMKSDSLNINQDPYAERPRKRKTNAFNYPQLIIKQSWQVEQKRFRAALLELDESAPEGVVCSGSYVSVHIQEKNLPLLKAACLTYNSKLATYYLLLSSGSFASYIPKANVEDLMQVPIPENIVIDLKSFKTDEEIDQHIQRLFSLKESEWLLIEDLFNYTLPDFKGDESSPGRRKTHRLTASEKVVEPELTDYCKYFLRVIKAGFGQDKQACATIFQEPNNTHLPVRLVAIHLNYSLDEMIKIEPLDSQVLLNRLSELNKIFLTQESSKDGGIFYQRIARVYDSIEQNGVTIPTIYLIKPDKVRYWTRSVALRDADEVASDIMLQRLRMN